MSLYSDQWATVHQTDALSGADLLEDQSIHTIVTSPPYWGLRSYLDASHADKHMEIGAEDTPEEYVEKLVEVFRALWPKLRDDGTLWLNLGDSFAGGGNGGGGSFAKDGIRAALPGTDKNRRTRHGERSVPQGRKPKDLMGVPWLVAFALQRDGWYLRSDIIWDKPNPMPESVTDRPTSAHEHIFLLTKKPRYFYDAEAIREEDSGKASGNVFKREHRESYGGRGNDEQWTGGRGRNKRNVWRVPPKPYAKAHHAVFPPALVQPCIEAGTSERGVCEECGAPWERILERSRTYESGSGKSGNAPSGKNGPGLQGGGQTKDIRRGPCVFSTTTGWKPSCSCDSEAVPATVLDPFMGSGTTAQVARSLGRKSVGFELDSDCAELIQERMGYQEVLL